MPRATHQHRNAEVDFRGEKRSNATPVTTTDPEARLDKKSPGTGAMLCFIGHALMENRCGLIEQGDLTQANGHAERRAALDMIQTVYRGVERVRSRFILTMAANNFARQPRLLAS